MEIGTVRAEGRHARSAVHALGTCVMLHLTLGESESESESECLLAINFSSFGPGVRKLYRTIAMDSHPPSQPPRRAAETAQISHPFYT